MGLKLNSDMVVDTQASAYSNTFPKQPININHRWKMHSGTTSKHGMAKS